MKQMVATAVFLFSITYIKEKKLFRFILFMVLAIGFHKIVIIYIPFYFLAKKMIPLKKSVPVVLAIIYFLSDKIRDFFIFITKQFGFYAGYFYNMHDKRTSSSVLLLINITVLLLMLIYMRKALYKDYENFIIFYNLQFVCTIFTVLMPIIPNGDRIVYLFLPSQIVSVPLLVNNLNKVNGNARKYKNILLCLYIIMYVKFILINNMGETLPYTFISF